MKCTIFVSIAALAATAFATGANNYAQCGGIGWTGSTTCATASAGTKCVAYNAYYSQCVPKAN
ncbi:hypothetical protein TWF694_010384 [Orbilia ellipsospora]|uniref:CBM1 domain-containing protein n=1 Tax=Orbilia ellipsospora TaxID=2528407 RepID=A0AAV9XAM4_9PEZI